MTNREILSAMDNMELATWLDAMPGEKSCYICKYSGRCGENKGDCSDGIMEWLESEVDYSGILR